MAEHHNRLEPFLLLARSTKGAAAAKVALDATAANGVYTFAELLELPNIKELENEPSLKKSYALLQLFAYGTLSDYAAAPDSFPPLSPAHQDKLKHLTLVSLALKHRSLPYSQLTEALQVATTSELESLIIDVIYADLLGGKMHHHERVFHVDWATGRDLSNNDLIKVKTGLENWCKNTETLLSALDTQIATVREQTVRDAEDAMRYQKAQDDAFLVARENVWNKSMGKNRAMDKMGGMFGDDGEDFDDELVAGLSGYEPRGMPSRSMESMDELANARAKKRPKD